MKHPLFLITGLLVGASFTIKAMEQSANQKKEKSLQMTQSLLSRQKPEENSVARGYTSITLNSNINQLEEQDSTRQCCTQEDRRCTKQICALACCVSCWVAIGAIVSYFTTSHG